MGAFTLVEILVAIVILAILCLLLVSLTSNMQGTLGYVVRRIDSDEMARLALAKISSDVESMFPRRDIPFTVSVGTSPTPFLGIISAVPAASGNRQIAAVYYRVQNDANSGAIFPTRHLTLQRAAKGIDYSLSGFMGVDTNNTPLPFSSLPAALQPADSDYDVLAEGVIAVNLSLLRTSDGTVVSATDSSILTNGGPDVSKISSLVVTLLVLDTKSFALLNSNQVNSIAAVFQPPSSTALQSGMLAAQEWTTIANNLTQFPGIPQPAIRSLRIYQRFIPLSAPSN